MSSCALSMQKLFKLELIDHTDHVDSDYTDNESVE